jgi:hypothetical protein
VKKLGILEMKLILPEKTRRNGEFLKIKNGKILKLYGSVNF